MAGMAVVPMPATAAFNSTSAAAPTRGSGATVGGDPLTILAGGILAAETVVDVTSSSTAVQGQMDTGQLGSSQVQSYVDRDESNAQVLSETGLQSC